MTLEERAAISAMQNLVERLREEAGRDDIAYRTVTVLMDAALEIERLRGKIDLVMDHDSNLIDALERHQK